jgi:hypothetical protein
MHIDAYVGHKHEGGEGARTYADVQPLDLLRVTGLIQHEGLELPRVFPPTGWSAPAVVADVLKTTRRE